MRSKITSSGVPAPVNYASVAIPPAIPDFFSASLDCLARLRAKAEPRIGAAVKIVVIQEAGLDGFWIHRLLESNGIESHVVEPASIAVPRRHRRAKTDVIDGEMLVRTLIAYKRGEPRVCSMVVAPTPEEEDRRRISRERRTLIKERIEHVNRINGLLASQCPSGIIFFLFRVFWP
jgi:transposase